MEFATGSQKVYITVLLTELGYDLDDYNLDIMTKQGAIELIAALKEEI